MRLTEEQVVNRLAAKVGHGYVNTARQSVWRCKLALEGYYGGGRLHDFPKALAAVGVRYVDGHYEEAPDGE